MTPDERWARRLAAGWVFWPVCVASVGLLAAAALGPTLARRLELEGQIGAMAEEVGRLEEDLERLQAARGALDHDPAYTERIIREELGLARPGEVRLPEPVAVETDADTPAVPAAPPAHVAAILRFADPRAQTAGILAGSLALGVALVLSLPTKPRPRTVGPPVG